MAARLTARARLTAVYIGLVGVAGVALIALTYLLVRNGTRVGITITNGPGTVPDVLPNLGALRSQSLNQLLLQSSIALGVVLVLAGVLGWLVAGRLLRPGPLRRRRRPRAVHRRRHHHRARRPDRRHRPAHRRPGRHRPATSSAASFLITGRP
jgi:hypothetical protein